MNIGKCVSFILKNNGNIVSSPWCTSVRFAKIKKRQSRKDTEFTDFALWRKERGLDTNPNKFGPLTNLPDYSFLDGRPVPVTQNLQRRLAKQREFAETIVRLSSEVDFARDRYRKMQQEKETEKRSIIEEKLKPKGPALLGKAGSSSKRNNSSSKR